ncbi:hypothetical protein PSV08DRAFT_246090 [Bipolaris maydis]|uniref:uncharacterized protein n=1 Tax=Cochliobolus heterostrophus TaxID=5016 RepID=UPI0024D0D385|nr:hypothetical protein J3E73DRAFT_262149 [Bipolaris maydis]KAJ6271947.1 hypothetical protein PSV08DRAFT_246090 [Bipolaris maydis]
MPNFHHTWVYIYPPHVLFSTYKPTISARTTTTTIIIIIPNYQAMNRNRITQEYPNNRPPPSLSTLQRLRLPHIFRNPFLPGNALPLGIRGKRAYVPGQEKLRVRDFVGEGGRGDEPGVGYRILVALDRVKRKGEEMMMMMKQHRQEEVRGRKEGGGARKSEREREKWSRGFYTP